MLLLTIYLLSLCIGMKYVFHNLGRETLYEEADSDSNSCLCFPPPLHLLY